MACEDCNKCLQVRLNGSFVYLATLIEKGELGPARAFFGNVIETEAQRAREDERKQKGEDDGQ